VLATTVSGDGDAIPAPSPMTTRAAKAKEAATPEATSKVAERTVDPGSTRRKLDSELKETEAPKKGLPEVGEAHPPSKKANLESTGRSGSTASVGYAKIHSIRVGPNNSKLAFLGKVLPWPIFSKPQVFQNPDKHPGDGLSVRLAKCDKSSGKYCDSIIVDFDKKPMCSDSVLKDANEKPLRSDDKPTMLCFDLKSFSAIDVKNGAMKMEFLLPSNLVSAVVTFKDKPYARATGSLIQMTFDKSGQMTNDQTRFLRALIERTQDIGGGFTKSDENKGVKMGLPPEIEYLWPDYTLTHRVWLKRLLFGQALVVAFVGLKYFFDAAHQTSEDYLIAGNASYMIAAFAAFGLTVYYWKGVEKILQSLFSIIMVEAPRAFYVAKANTKLAVLGVVGALVAAMIAWRGYIFVKTVVLPTVVLLEPAKKAYKKLTQALDKTKTLEEEKPGAATQHSTTAADGDEGGMEGDDDDDDYDDDDDDDE